MGRRLALLIATYQYDDDGLSRLTAPGQDAEGLAEVLRDPRIAGFETTMLVNEPHYKVGAAIGEFYRDRRRDDLTLLYFSGHGLKDDAGNLYLAMQNTRRDNLLFTALSAEQIDQAMSSGRSSRMVLILDCCYSGAFPAGKLAKGDAQVHALEHFQGRGRTVLTASDATQYSFEGDQVQGEARRSVFTRHLVKGLRDGSADLDGDGDITIDEWYSYVHDNVVAEMPQQRPKKLDDVQGRTVIARNVNWSLPVHLRNALASPMVADRLAAVESLAHLHRAENEIVRARVADQLQRLTEDDSKQVSSAAAAVLGGLPPAERSPEEPDLLPAGDDPALATDITMPLTIVREHSPGNAAPEPVVPAPAALPGRARPDRLTVLVVALTLLVAAITSAWYVVKTPSQPDAAGSETTAAATPPAPPLGTPIGRPLTGQSGSGLSLAATTINDHPAIVSGSSDTFIRVWDLASGSNLGTEPFAGHTNAIGSLVVTRIGGKPVAVSGSDDRTIRRWNLDDLDNGRQIGTSLTGHTEGVWSLAAGRLGRRDVAISGGPDATVRIWDLATGEQVGAPLTGHTGVVTGVSLVRVGGRQLILSTGDRTLRLWDPYTGDQIGEPMTGHRRAIWSMATGTLNGRPIAVTGGSDHDVRVWDLASRDAVGEPLTGHTAGVGAVAITMVGDRTVAVTGANDKAVRAWDLTAHRALGEPFRGHAKSVRSVVTTTLDHHPVAVSGSDDRTIRVWSLGA